MTGSELRTCLADWSISRRQFADALAVSGYAVDPSTISAWNKAVAPYAARLIERWRDNPEQRPGKVEPHIAGIG